MRTTTPAELEDRITTLERALHRTRLIASLACIGLGAVSLTGFVRGPAPSDELRTRRLIVVDDKGRTRIELGEDREDFRISRSAGLTVYDTTGAERGGIATMQDGRVVLALDAPHGVGSPMRDRLGLVVGADGSSHVMLIDNATRAVAKLHSDGKGGGGVQVFQWADNVVRTRTTTYDGDVRDSTVRVRR